MDAITKDWTEKAEARNAHVAAGGRVVYVIPCGGAKVDHRARAADLYTGSMFQTALQAVAAQGDGEVLILSALHGLLRLDDMVDPYDVKMGDADSITPETLHLQASFMGLNMDGVEVHAFLPKAYLNALNKSLNRDAISAYTKTRGIGEHRKVCRLARESAAQK